MQTHVSVHVPAGEGRTTALRSGERLRVVDVEGGQVGDLFAFLADDPAEYLSASHTRAATSRLFPAVGEPFFSNRRRALLRLEADDSPGVHDMLIAACDAERYAGLGIDGWHASCAENLAGALAEHGVTATHVPDPVNLFMNIPVGDGGLDWLPAPSAPGASVTFRALADVIVVVSACPQDVVAINGHRPTPLILEVLR
jgi:uncharacterized protein YcgI (DUF1989 family)